MGRSYVVRSLVTLGDLMLDVIVRLGEPLSPGADASATTRTGAGGQAANVAAWAVALDARARCVAKRGSDTAGQLLTAELEARGVELAGPTEGRNGVVVSIVGPTRTSSCSLILSPMLAPLAVRTDTVCQAPLA